MSGQHVPGLYRCAKCGFQLVQATMRASDGSVGFRDNPGQQCPNDNFLLHRVTWEAHAAELGERAGEYLTRAIAAEERCAELEAALDPFAEAAKCIPPEKYDTDEGRFWLVHRIQINCGTFRRALAARGQS